MKNVFLKILQNSEENIFAGVAFSRDSSTKVFLWIGNEINPDQNKSSPQNDTSVKILKSQMLIPHSSLGLLMKSWKTQFF